MTTTFPAIHVSKLSDTAILLRRSFEAPRKAVFDAFTRPEIVREWLWARDAPMTVCEIDLKVGGSMRYVWRLANGKDMGMSGVFVEIVPPERTVHTEVFDEDWTDGEATVTTTFSERDGRTTVDMRIEYRTGKVRDTVLDTGMVDGIEEAYGRLDAFLAGG